jgi:hypothetical protein
MAVGMESHIGDTVSITGFRGPQRGYRDLLTYMEDAGTP